MHWYLAHSEKETAIWECKSKSLWALTDLNSTAHLRVWRDVFYNEQVYLYVAISSISSCPDFELHFEKRLNVNWLHLLLELIIINCITNSFWLVW